MDLLKFTLFVLVLLWIGWFLVGGPERGKTGLPFLSPPAPLGTGEIYGPSTFIPGMSQTSGEGPATEEDKKTISIFEGSFSMQSGNARATNPNEEYIVITASYSNTQPVSITGWKLKSATSEAEVTIGKGVYLPSYGAINKEESVFLNPGDRAVISTGRAPNGISFRLNSCTGYFEQFQDFTPSLPRDCPYLGDETLPVSGPERLDETCVDYIKSIATCTAHVAAIPVGLNPECNDYINKNIHYNGCVSLHKNDANFYKSEWRLFLNRDAELWKQSRETIKLLDAQGKVIDSVSY